MPILGARLDNEQNTYVEVDDGGTKIAQRVKVVGMTVESTAPTTTSGTPAAVVVSTSSVLLSALNLLRLSIVITNNGPGELYIGHTSGVTSSGATMGLLIPAFGSYSDSGFGLYTGDLYGIYSEASLVHNVSISERIE